MENAKSQCPTWAKITKNATRRAKGTFQVFHRIWIKMSIFKERKGEE